MKLKFKFTYRVELDAKQWEEEKIDVLAERLKDYMELFSKHNNVKVTDVFIKNEK